MFTYYPSTKLQLHVLSNIIPKYKSCQPNIKTSNSNKSNTTLFTHAKFTRVFSEGPSLNLLRNVLRSHTLIWTRGTVLKARHTLSRAA
jgi:hypothetical protein